MKMLKKLALVSAVSMISAGSFAMEAMDEETMSATTGQDGITINIVPDAISRTSAAAMGVTAPTMDALEAGAPFYKGLSIGEIRVHDDDGLGAAGAATANSGALVIGDGTDRTVILAKGDKPIQINIDMVGDSNGSAAGGGAMLNVEIKQPKMAIKLGSIYVANSNAGATDRDADGVAGAFTEVDGTSVSGKVKILDGLEIVMNESTMTIQLGNEAQGSMIKADATLSGGLTINNFKLYDQQGSAALTADNLALGTVGSGGNFRASSLKITDNGGADLTTKTAIDFGSRVTTGTTVTTGGAVEAAFKDAAAVKAGFASYAAAPGAVQTAIDATFTYTKTLADGAAATAGTWGGVDTYNGLVITSELGGATGADITINNAAVGDSNAAIIGDVQIVGLMLGKSKIVIMGH